jgi:hypothetical protein
VAKSDIVQVLFSRRPAPRNQSVVRLDDFGTKKLGFVDKEPGRLQAEGEHV